MPPSRLPRHAAGDASQPRAVLLPAVLLTSAALAFGGLAVLPASAALRVSAAAATSPLILADGANAPSKKDLDTLYGIPAPIKPMIQRVTAADPPAADPPAAPSQVAPREAPRASRERTVVAAPDYVLPDAGVFTSGFKWRWGRMHAGIDLAGPYGSPVRAVTAGIVVEAGEESGYGNIVKIRHADGVETYYAHLSSILVAGGPVAAGQVIALEGNTGHSTGPHLHFEVHINDVAIDPVPWLAEHGISI